MAQFVAEERRTAGMLTDAVTRAEAAEASLETAQASIARYDEEARRTAALPVPRVTVALRDGTRLTGAIVGRDTTNLVLKTDEGTQTVAWRSVTPATLMTLDADLYAALKAQAESRTHATNTMSRVLKTPAPKALTKEEEKAQWLAKISLGIDAAEGCKVTDRNIQSTAFYQDRKNSSAMKATGTRFSCWAKIEVKVEGLAPTEQHTFKLSATCYRKSLATGIADAKDTIEKEEALTGKDDYSFDYQSDPYEFFKAGRNMTGFQNDGFDIKVWLDGTLIYEQKRNARGEYYQVRKH